MIHYNILDKKRREILPCLQKFKSDFYLAGGTGLALQLGHRDSVDFDLFAEHNFSNSRLLEKTIAVFADHKITVSQQEKNTLTIIIDEKIKISFFAYSYKLLEKTIDDKFFRIASIQDIGCMKLSAIVSRATTKDYYDLYFILQDIKLEYLLQNTIKKYPELDINLVLKSIIYFEDIKPEKIKFLSVKAVSFEVVKSFLAKQVKLFYKNKI
jgi:predicted nucleotidyltransferase component of viral defense system